MKRDGWIMPWPSAPAPMYTEPSFTASTLFIATFAISPFTWYSNGNVRPVRADT